MKKEDADQLIRCFRECWWRVGLLLLLVFTFILLVLYGWPSGDWAFGWGFVGALATSVTGCAAVQIAYHQKRVADQSRENLNWISLKEANHLLNEISHQLARVFWAVESLVDGGAIQVQQCKKVLHYVFEIKNSLPREDSRYAAPNLIDGELMDAMHELKTHMTNLAVREFDEGKIDFSGSDDLKIKVLTTHIYSELQELSEIVAATGHAFDLMGFIGLKQAMVSRFQRVSVAVREIWLPEE
ncbi:hypothetical protein [Alcaligenes faecalis]|uniref:hypothetical protein n=1 Tax=Alcaligenes faecalis TaxID=511 RepID=UPI002AA70E2F|nr:hypothetical protein [Alcaligenes faecalis]